MADLNSSFCVVLASHASVSKVLSLVGLWSLLSLIKSEHGNRYGEWWEVGVVVIALAKPTGRNEMVQVTFLLLFKTFQVINRLARS